MSWQCFSCAKIFKFECRLNAHLVLNNTNNKNCGINKQHILDNYKNLNNSEKDILLLKLLQSSETPTKTPNNTNKINCIHCNKLISKYNMIKHLKVCKEKKEIINNKLATTAGFIITDNLKANIKNAFENSQGYSNSKLFIKFMTFIFKNNNNNNFGNYQRNMFFYTAKKEKSLIQYEQFINLIRKTIQYALIDILTETVFDHLLDIEDGSVKSKFITFISSKKKVEKYVFDKSVRPNYPTSSYTSIKFKIDQQVQKNKIIMQQYFLNHKC